MSINKLRNFVFCVILSIISIKSNSLIIGSVTYGASSIAFFVAGGASSLYGAKAFQRYYNKDYGFAGFLSGVDRKLGVIALGAGIILSEKDVKNLALESDIVSWAEENFYNDAVISKVSDLSKKISSKNNFGKNITIKKFSGNKKSRVLLIQKSLEETFDLKNISYESAELLYDYII